MGAAESGPELPILRMQHCASRITGTIWAISGLLREANSFENYKVFVCTKSSKIYPFKLLWKKLRLVFISIQIFNDIGTNPLAALMPHYWMNRPAT